jgi:hypothetical protein
MSVVRDAGSMSSVMQSVDNSKWHQNSASRAMSDFNASPIGRVRGSNPRVGVAIQAVHQSGVGKLVAISWQRMTTVEGCEAKACGCTMTGVRLMQLVAQTTTCWFPAVRSGVLRSSNSWGAKEVQVYLYLILQQLGNFCRQIRRMIGVISNVSTNRSRLSRDGSRLPGTETVDYTMTDGSLYSTHHQNGSQCRQHEQLGLNDPTDKHQSEVLR